MRSLDGVLMTASEIAAQRGISFDPAVSRRDRAKIRRTIRDSFTQEEEKLISGRDRLEIGTDSVDPEYSGAYYRRHGKQPARAVVEDPGNADTVVHEITHHLRAIDGRRTGVARAYPTSPRDPRLARDVENVEEAATVAETAARTRRPAKRTSGYYGDVPAVRDGSMTRVAAYRQDRQLLTRGRGQLVGRPAVTAVSRDFDKTQIAKKKLGGIQARNSWKIISRRKNGN